MITTTKHLLRYLRTEHRVVTPRYPNPEGMTVLTTLGQIINYALQANVIDERTATGLEKFWGDKLNREIPKA